MVDKIIVDQFRELPRLHIEVGAEKHNFILRLMEIFFMLFLLIFPPPGWDIGLDIKFVQSEMQLVEDTLACNS